MNNTGPKYKVKRIAATQLQK